MLERYKIKWAPASLPHQSYFESGINSESDLVQVSNNLPTAILKPIISSPLLESEVQIYSPQQSVSDFMSPFNSSQILTVDLETTGLEVRTCQIVCFGFSDGKITAYIPIERGSSLVEEVISWMQEFKGDLAGFNIAFDAAVIQVYSGKWLNWKWDAYSLFKSLSNEGWWGQNWHLKSAQLDFLGWKEKGSEPVDQWLVQHGYYTSTHKTPTKKHNIFWEGKWWAADKSEMWRCEAKILGYYCALDAYSTHLLLTQVLLPSIQLEWRDAALGYHALLILNTKEIVRNRIVGFTLNEMKLEKYYTDLKMKIIEEKEKIWNESVIQEFTQIRNQAERSKKKEPIKFTKQGKVTSAWVKWSEKQEGIMKQKMNLGSGAQLISLFYTHLGATSTEKTKKDGLSVGVKALKGWVIQSGRGEKEKIVGRIAASLLACRKLEKELTYVEACKQAGELR